jgi:hypothetical protein
MEQGAIASLLVDIIAVLVACFGIYITWRIAKGQMQISYSYRTHAETATGPLRRWQRQRTQRLPVHNHRRQHFRRRFGVMFVDEIVGQDWTNKLFPMAAGMGNNRSTGFID